MDKRKVIISPKAERDLLKLPAKDADRIVDDLAILETPPWPRGKVKKLRSTEYWEIKTGSYRSIFFQERKKVVVLRVINRRDLFRSVKHIDIEAITRWLREHEK